MNISKRSQRKTIIRPALISQLLNQKAFYIKWYFSSIKISIDKSPNHKINSYIHINIHGGPQRKHNFNPEVTNFFEMQFKAREKNSKHFISLLTPYIPQSKHLNFVKILKFIAAFSKVFIHWEILFQYSHQTFLWVFIS